MMCAIQVVYSFFTLLRTFGAIYLILHRMETTVRTRYLQRSLCWQINSLPLLCALFHQTGDIVEVYDFK